jgi:hypothetical protein
LNYLVTFASDTPTQEQCQDLYEEESGLTGEALEGTVIFDQTRQIYAKWYTVYDLWEIFAGGAGGDTVSVANNSGVLGIVTGSNEAGKVFVETDGSLSLNGYDTLTSDINDNTNAIAEKLTIPTGDAEQVLDGTGTPKDFIGTTSTTAMAGDTSVQPQSTADYQVGTADGSWTTFVAALEALPGW